MEVSEFQIKFLIAVTHFLDLSLSQIGSNPASPNMKLNIGNKLKTLKVVTYWLAKGIVLTGSGFGMDSARPQIFPLICPPKSFLSSPHPLESLFRISYQVFQLIWLWVRGQIFKNSVRVGDNFSDVKFHHLFFSKDYSKTEFGEKVIFRISR
jgi:hypothetical protein